jgi:uncharacterized membrane protein
LLWLVSVLVQRLLLVVVRVQGLFLVVLVLVLHVLLLWFDLQQHSQQTKEVRAGVREG